MHVPEGGTPKDGPSAGITITTSLLSLAYGVPSNPAFAMTGELTLTGKVLPIGGVKEKVLAAKRAGVTNLIFPHDNQRDFDELPDNLKDGVNPHFVNYYQEVFDLVFDSSSLPQPVKKKTKAKRVTKAEKLALQEASA
jgi:ATP-dependent Lon protease